MVSFDDATPIYLQIAEEIRSSILDGSRSEGSRLTSTTEYATTYRINPATANKALALLVDEGLVVKRRGVGMFVADGALESLRASRRATYSTQVLSPALDAGLVLGLSPQDLRDAVERHLAASAPTAPAAPPSPAPSPGAAPDPGPGTLATVPQPSPPHQHLHDEESS